MGKRSGSIEIVSGNRVGKPFAVYASDGAGGFSRADFRTAAEARATAKTLSRSTGWPISDALGTDRPQALRSPVLGAVGRAMSPLFNRKRR